MEIKYYFSASDFSVGAEIMLEFIWQWQYS
jgi:hypothetical protein